MSHVRLHGLTVAYGRTEGIAASAISQVTVENCSVFGIGQDAVRISGTDSQFLDSEIHSCG